MTESEVWKDVVGFEGFYKVSNRGNVRSIARKDSIGRKRGGRTLKPQYDKGGYPRVQLSKNGKQKTRFIHRLVAGAFIPNPKSFLEVNHLDEIKDNNELSNLEWCTREHNINHGKRTERASQTQSKRVKAVNVETGEVITFNSVTEAINRGYSSAVSQACQGIYYGGNLYRSHKWAYEEEEINERPKQIHLSHQIMVG